VRSARSDRSHQHLTLTLAGALVVVVPPRGGGLWEGQLGVVTYPQILKRQKRLSSPNIKETKKVLQNILKTKKRFHNYYNNSIIYAP
jgi:hypothetical protein